MKDIGVYYAAGPISMMHIDAKEIESGYRFPKNYKELLAQNDFLRPKLDLFKFYRNGSQDERDVNFFGYLND
ncbi:MAG: hypothetical protein LBM17_06615, partial [Candidatus Accumulibacter sp.]|nr:hypothetical protein [Accumulibacter sp.]